MKKMVLCYDNNSYVITERETGERIYLYFEILLQLALQIYCKTSNSCDAVINYFLRFSCFKLVLVLFPCLFCCKWDQL